MPIIFSECLKRDALQERSNKFINIVPRLLALGPIKLNHALNKLLNSDSFFPNPHLNQQSTSGQEAEAGETDKTFPFALSVFCTYELTTIADDIRACIDELELSDTPTSTSAHADPLKDTRSFILFFLYYLEVFSQNKLYSRDDQESIIQTVRKLLDELHAVLRTHLATEADNPRNRHLSELLDLYIPEIETHESGSPVSVSLPWRKLLERIVGDPSLLRYALTLRPKIDRSDSYMTQHEEYTPFPETHDPYSHQCWSHAALAEGEPNFSLLKDEGFDVNVLYSAPPLGETALQCITRLAAKLDSEDRRNEFFRAIERLVGVQGVITTPSLLCTRMELATRAEEIIATATERSRNPESDLQYPAIEPATPAVAP
ncbi:MAG: hypothetical protein CMF52_09015 [Legionellales bacterium]|nr:hypothetical protein [Legionellales bacterium]